MPQNGILDAYLRAFQLAEQIKYRRAQVQRDQAYIEHIDELDRRNQEADVAKKEQEARQLKVDEATQRDKFRSKGGVRLEQDILKEYEDGGDPVIDLGSGVMGHLSSSGGIERVGDDAFFMPSAKMIHALEIARNLEKQKAEAALKQPERHHTFNAEGDATIFDESGAVNAVIKGIGLKRQPPAPSEHQATDDQGNVTLYNRDGVLRTIPGIGKKTRESSEGQLTPAQQRQKTTEQLAGFFLAGSGGNIDLAIDAATDAAASNADVEADLAGVRKILEQGRSARTGEIRAIQSRITDRAFDMQQIRDQIVGAQQDAAAGEGGWFGIGKDEGQINTAQKQVQQYERLLHQYEAEQQADRNLLRQLESKVHATSKPSAPWNDEPARLSPAAETWKRENLGR